MTGDRDSYMFIRSVESWCFLRDGLWNWVSWLNHIHIYIYMYWYTYLDILFRIQQGSKIVLFCKKTISGWWYTNPSEKYEFVTWDDDIPNWMKSHKIPWFQTTNQYSLSCLSPRGNTPATFGLTLTNKSRACHEPKIMRLCGVMSTPD